MVKVEIRQSKADEELDVHDLQMHYAFHASPNMKKVEEDKVYREYDAENINFVVLEDGNPLSVGTSVPMKQNIRGKIFEMSGIAGIASFPEGRKKGYVRKLMLRFFEDMKSRNQVFSTLYPFRESFYGNLGYFSFPQIRRATFSPYVLKNIAEYETNTTIKRYLMTDFLVEYKQFLTQFMETTHSACRFTDLTMGRFTIKPTWVAAIYDENKELIGVLLYTISGYEGKLNVRRFLYLNSNAKYAMLGWLYRHIDQVKEIVLPLIRGEFAESWDNDLKIEIKSRDWVPEAMGRVVIVDQLNGMSVGQGNLILKIEDNHCTWNNGVWTFTSENGKLKVTSGGEPEGEVTIQGLSSIIYGHYDLDDFKFRGWGKISSLLALKITQMFEKKPVFLNEDF